MGTDTLLTALSAGLLRFVFVKEGTNQIVTRFGKFDRVLEPGLQCFPSLLGFAGQIHSFSLKDPVLGTVTNTTEIDIKEIVYDYPKERVISRDNVQFDVNAVIYFRVFDPYRAIFNVSNYLQSIRTLVQSILRAEIGKHDLEETYTNRSHISDALTAEADKATDDWGIKVIRLEIKEFELGEFAQNLLDQKKQDIERRQQIIEAEGSRAARIKEAEGERDATVLIAEGKKMAADAEAQAIKIKAEAQAAAVRMEYEAEAQGYAAVASSIRENPEITYFLKLNTADKISKNLSDGKATKLLLPNNMEQLVSAFALTSEAVPGGAPMSVGSND